MRTKLDNRLTLAVPGGLAGQLFAVGYAAWISSELQKAVHVQFHDVGTSIAKLGVAELLATPTAKNLGIEFSKVDGDWPPHRTSIAFTSRIDRIWQKTRGNSLATKIIGILSRSRNYFRSLRSRGTAVSLGSHFGVITRSNLESAPIGSVIVGYPVDYQIVEDSWPLLAQMIRESGMPDFTSGTATENSVAVHWRLGDYVGNSTHGAVRWTSIARCLEVVNTNNDPVNIFTDSPNLARHIIGPQLRECGYTIISGQIWADIKLMTRSKTFVGTNSGISFLAALALSQGESPSQIWLPRTWFLDRDAERHFNPPRKTFGISSFFPVELVTLSSPS